MIFFMEHTYQLNKNECYGLIFCVQQVGVQSDLNTNE